MLWFVAWLALASPEVRVEVRVQVQVSAGASSENAADAKPGNTAGDPTPATAPAPAERSPTIYSCFLDEIDSDYLVDCDQQPELCRRDRRRWLITVRPHFLAELTRLAQDDFNRVPRP